MLPSMCYEMCWKCMNILSFFPCKKSYLSLHFSIVDLLQLKSTSMKPTVRRRKMDPCGKKCTHTHKIKQKKLKWVETKRRKRRNINKSTENMNDIYRIGNMYEWMKFVHLGSFKSISYHRKNVYLYVCIRIGSLPPSSLSFSNILLLNQCHS